MGNVRHNSIILFTLTRSKSPHPSKAFGDFPFGIFCYHAIPFIFADQT